MAISDMEIIMIVVPIIVIIFVIHRSLKLRRQIMYNQKDLMCRLDTIDENILLLNDVIKPVQTILSSLDMLNEKSNKQYEATIHPLRTILLSVNDLRDPELIKSAVESIKSMIPANTPEEPKMAAKRGAIMTQDAELDDTQPSNTNTQPSNTNTQPSNTNTQPSMFAPTTQSNSMFAPTTQSNSMFAPTTSGLQTGVSVSALVESLRTLSSV